MKTTAALALILATLPITQTHAGGSSSVGPAHPAAFLCEKVGGQDMEHGLCNLGEATIGSMTLWYHRETGSELATRIFLAHPKLKIEEPAVDYCLAAKGNVETHVTHDGSAVAVCTFSEDGHLSTIGLQTLYRGPKDPRNAALVRALKKK